MGQFAGDRCGTRGGQQGSLREVNDRAVRIATGDWRVVAMESARLLLHRADADMATRPEREMVAVRDHRRGILPAPR